MHLDPNSVIAGRPARAVRAFLRRAAERTWCAQEAARLLGEPEASSEDFVAALLEEGLIEWVEEEYGETLYSLTLNGRAVALATFAPPVHRSTAERVLGEFLARVRRVNHDPYYLYRVKRVLLFGSMLTDAARVSDVDVAVRLESKEPSPSRRAEREARRTERALEEGRDFANFTEMLAWPQREVLLYLKSRSRTLSLHGWDDAVLERCDTRVIYPTEAPRTRSGIKAPPPDPRAAPRRRVARPG